MTLSLAERRERHTAAREGVKYMADFSFLARVKAEILLYPSPEANASPSPAGGEGE